MGIDVAPLESSGKMSDLLAARSRSLRSLLSLKRCPLSPLLLGTFRQISLFVSLKLQIRSAPGNLTHFLYFILILRTDKNGTGENKRNNENYKA
jgi:hypothetical protein